MKKIIPIIFLNLQGVMLTEFVLEDKTVNKEYYNYIMKQL